MTRRFARYEGGHIGVSGDRALAAAWYGRHLGTTVAWDHPAEGQTLLRFPGPHAIPLVSVAGGEVASVWGETGREARATNVRLCLASPSLHATHAALASEGVRVSPIAISPDGRAWFDLFDLEGTRLTLVAADDEDAAVRVSGYAPPRYGVRDVDAAVAWYGAHLGTTLRERYPGAALLDLGDWLPIWLEQLPPDADTTRRTPFARPYYLAPDLDEAHSWAASAGLDPSSINGDQLRVFRCWDPDGNELCAWCYPGAA